MMSEELRYRLAAIDFLFCRGEHCSPVTALSIFGKILLSDKFNMCVNIEFT